MRSRALRLSFVHGREGLSFSDFGATFDVRSVEFLGSVEGMRIGVAVLAAGPALAAGLLSVFLFSGCESSTIYEWELGRNCTPIEARVWGCEVCPHTCALLDAGADAPDGADGVADAAEEADGGMACEGECVPNHGVKWLGPVLVWTGPEGEAPACPDQAKTAEDWHANLIVPPASCGSCSCDPPVGSCTLPTEMSVSTATCAGPQSGAWSSAFDAPAGWDGSCTSMNAFPAGCNGNLCSKSVTISPLMKTEGPCASATVGSMEPPAAPTWGTFARTCIGTPHSGTGGCEDSDHVCAPATAPGFSQCTYREGDFPCQPDKLYTERHVLYEGFADTRSCASCTCGEVVGSSCFAKVSVFTDSSCSAVLETHSIDTTGSSCFDVLPAGSALGSKSAGPVTYNPGVCQPGGGGLTGSAEPLFPTTFCCLPT